jgi:hypothetical protein
MTLSSRLVLWITLFALASVDAGLTLRGQPARYWQGDYASVQELNPLGRVLLQCHPLAFGLSAVVESAAVGLLLLIRPTRLVVRSAVLLAFLHAFGAAGWFVRASWPGCLVACALLVAAERFLTLSWRRSWLNRPTRSGAPRGVSVGV